MQAKDYSTYSSSTPRNQGKIVGPKKPPFKLQEVWAI